MLELPTNWAAVPLILTAEETAALLGLDAPQVVALCQEGRLRAVELAGGWRVRRDDVMALLHMPPFSEPLSRPEAEPALTDELTRVNAELQRQAEELSAQEEELRVQNLELTETAYRLEEALSREQALAEQFSAAAKFLTTIMDTVPVAITYLDENLIYRQCNQVAAREIGLPVEQVLGRSVREIVPGNPQLWGALESVLETGDPAPLPMITIRFENRPNDGPVDYVISFVPLKDATERVSGVIAVAHNLTELVEARRLLSEHGTLLGMRVRERTAELEAIIESLPDAVLVGDIYGVNRCNQAALGILGLDRASDLPAGYPELNERMHNRYLATGEAVPLADTAYAHALRGERWNYEAITRNLQTGEDVILRCISRPVILGGKVSSVVVVDTDITEQKRAEEALRASHEQLRGLTRRLMEIQEAERRSIARELHDEAAQTITFLSVGLAASALVTGCPPLLAEQLQAYSQAASELGRELHELMSTLRPASLDRAGLVPALSQYLDIVRVRHSLAGELATRGLQGERLPAEIEVVVYRLVQEALTNVVRHARASAVKVTLERTGATLAAVVEDDGVGFDVGAAAQGNRLGLVGMRERADMVGGRLTVDSAPGHGTRIAIEIPLPG